jgi:tRNA A37 methylthiotransferase MiaB
MKKLEILFIIPSLIKDEKIPIYPLAPLKLEAYCRDIANFHIIYEEDFDDSLLNNIDIIAITTTFTIPVDFMYHGTTEILNLIKNIRKVSNIKIFLGGNLPMYYPEIENYVDWCCYYEGEKPLRKALLAFMDNKIIPHSREKEFLSSEELNLIPPIKLENFSTYIPIQLGIGCRSNCIFCASNLTQGKNLRHCSYEKIISDITYYIDNGIKEFLIIDDDIFADKEYYTKVLSFLIKQKVKAYFLYIPIYIDLEDLELLAKLTDTFEFHPDACNEKSFKTSKKRGDWNNLEKYVKYIRNIKPDSIITIRILIHYPNETEQERLDSLEFFSKLPVDSVEYVTLRITRGTPIYDELKLDNREIFKKFISGAKESEKLNEEINRRLKC